MFASFVKQAKEFLFDNDCLMYFGTSDSVLWRPLLIYFVYYYVFSTRLFYVENNDTL